MVILLSGSDSYRIAQRIDFLRNAFLKKFASQNPVTYTSIGNNVDIAALRIHTHSQGLFAQKVCVVISHAEEVSVDQREALEHLFDTVPEETIVLITLAPSQKKGAWTTLKNHVTKTEDYGTLEVGDIRTWVRSEAKKQNLTLSSSHIERLITASNNDLWTISHILHQIAHTEQPITEETFAAFLPEKDAGSVFVLIDALAQKKLGSVLRAVDEQLSNDNSVHALLTLIGKHLGLLHHVLDTPDEPIDVHPYALKKAQTQARAFTPKQLRSLLAELLDLDQQLKNSAIDEHAALMLFCTHACT